MFGSHITGNAVCFLLLMIFFMSVIHTFLLSTSSFHCFASFSPAASNASVSYSSILPFILTIVIYIPLFSCIPSSPSPVSPSVPAVPPVHLLYPPLFLLSLLSIAYRTVPSRPQPAVINPPAPTGTDMNLSTSRPTSEFEPSTYLLNVTDVCFRKEQIRERHCISH